MAASAQKTKRTDVRDVKSLLEIIRNARPSELVLVSVLIVPIILGLWIVPVARFTESRGRLGSALNLILY